MVRIFIALVCACLLAAPGARAQENDPVWVQIEAQPSLAEARARIRDYAARLEDVNGFSLGGGWYAVALGPYARDDADSILRSLRLQGLIPRDAYIARSSDYRQQFWPIGANALNQPALDLNAPPAETAQNDPAPEANEATAEADPAPLETPAAIEPPDETPAEARASESELTREERALLQEALQWSGHYAGAIDAAFGRGTRASMARWQEANGHETTGILTTGQRRELLAQYNAVLEGLGLELVRDEDAGIAIEMPTAFVAFEKYEPPFAHYVASGDVNARVLLISQQGTQDTLAGLYDIMQTLRIVPETGPRSLDGDNFTLIGEGALQITHAQAWLEDGTIKGSRPDMARRG